MKKILNTLLLVLLFVVVTFTVSCSGARVGDYTLSKVLGSSEVESGSQNVGYDYYESNEIKQLSIKKLSDITTTQEENFTTSVDGEVATIFNSTISADEWLVIYVNQPIEVVEQYVIQSVTIKYPGGVEVKWQNLTTDEVGRRMRMSLDGLRIYIPINVPHSVGEYSYSVEAIEYLYLQEDYLVRKTDNTIDTIVVIAGGNKARLITMGSYADGFKLVEVHSYIDGLTLSELNIIAYRFSDEEDWNTSINGIYSLNQSLGFGYNTPGVADRLINDVNDSLLYYILLSLRCSNGTTEYEIVVKIDNPQNF
jgi:hypothetical protein